MSELFAAFVVLVIIGIVIDTFNAHLRVGDAAGDQAPVRHGLTGTFAGLLSGVLGISGGVIAVPGQTLLAGVPLRQAIANSTLITAASSTLGAILLFTPISGAPPSFAEMASVAVLFVPGNLIGGTFTITNLGMFGVETFVPIINPPETAILGVGAIIEKPVADEGKIDVKPLIRLTLSFDHRVINGAPAARFMQRLKQVLEGEISEKD